MAINQNITDLPTPPQLGQDQDTFDTNASNFLNAVDDFADELNTFADEVNITQTEINNSESQAITAKNLAETYKNEALSSANTATSAKNVIQSYVVPTEATYTFSEIDKLSSVAYPNSGYTRVSKKLDNFVFQESSSFLNKVADKNRFVKFGEKVVDTYGPELVTKGDFSDGTTGWVGYNGSLLEEINGQCKVTGQYIQSVTNPLESSKLYKVTAYFKDAINSYTSVNNGIETITASYKGDGIYEWVMKGGSRFIIRASNTVAYIDNISVREIQTAQFQVPEVAEIITNGSNTTSVAVNAGDYVLKELPIADEYIQIGQNYDYVVGTIWYIDNSFTNTVSGAGFYQSTTSGNYTATSGTVFSSWVFLGDASDTFRAKQDAPIGTALTNTTYFEDRTQIGVINQYLDAHKEDDGVYVGKIPELLLSDVSKEDLLDNPTWLARNGYSKVSKYLYSKGTSKYVISGQYTTLNKGLFHPMLNIMGTRKASDDKYWYDTTVSFTSVADCFDESKLLLSSGNVASGKSGRPTEDETPYYDVCYPSLYQDMREYAKLLTRDEVELIRADKEENGIEEIVVTLTNKNGNGTNLYYDYGDGRLAMYYPSNYFNSIKIGSMIDISYYDGTARYSDRNLIVTNNINNILYFTSSIIDSAYGSVGAVAINGIKEFMVTFTKPILSSNTKLSIDLIGDPTNYPQIMKDRLASGVGVVGINPLLVGQNGTDYTVGTTQYLNVTLSNKVTSFLNGLRQSTAGNYVQYTTANYQFNSVDNQFEYIGLVSDNTFFLMHYTSKNKPYIQTTPKQVIDVEPKVIASNSHSIYKGALIGNQVSGKVQVGNGDNGYESKVLENALGVEYDIVAEVGDTIATYPGMKILVYRGTDVLNENDLLIRRGVSSNQTISQTFDYKNSSNWSVVLGYKTIPTHSTIALDNNNGEYTPASKYFKAIEQGDNGVLAGVYGKELAYNNGTTSFDGDNELFDQLTNGTKTDLNGKTVRTFHGSIAINGEVR